VLAKPESSSWENEGNNLILFALAQQYDGDEGFTFYNI
jgi:hypothetical protein